MKTADIQPTRRDFLAAAGKFGVVSWLGNEGITGRSCHAAEDLQDPTAGELQFYQLHVEPFVKSSYPVHERFDNGLAEQRVVITAKDMDRLDWEVRPEKTSWMLHLPEMVYVDRKRFDYQVGMQWKRGATGWSYTDCPFRNLGGRWVQRDGKFQLDEGAEDLPAVGTIQGTVHADALGAHYEMTLTNSSADVLRNVFFWIDLGHYHAAITGHRPHLRVGKAWLPAQEMPPAETHVYYPAPGMVDEYRTAPQNRPEFHAADTELSFPGVVCWNLTAKGPLLVCHCSHDAMAVGSNQLWPCTDLQLWFGDLAPGQKKTRTGHVFIARSDLQTFARHADSILDVLALATTGKHEGREPG